MEEPSTPPGRIPPDRTSGETTRDYPPRPLRHQRGVEIEE